MSLAHVCVDGEAGLFVCWRRSYLSYERGGGWGCGGATLAAALGNAAQSLHLGRQTCPSSPLGFSPCVCLRSSSQPTQMNTHPCFLFVRISYSTVMF